MAQYGDPEGTFSSVRTAATPDELAAYRATPQFAVSVPKLAVMAVCTFGLYEVYWAYKQWEAVRKREGEKLSPVWRAIFAPLWALSLFPRTQRLTAIAGSPATWSAPALAIAYLVMHATWRLPDPYWLVSVLSFLPLLVVQGSINALNATAAPEAPRNDSYSGANIVAIVVGGLLVLLTIWGSLLSAPPGGPVYVPVTT